MTHPWSKMSRFMCIFRSSARRLADTMRGQAEAQVHRQVTAAVYIAGREVRESPADVDGALPGRSRMKRWA